LEIGELGLPEDDMRECLQAAAFSHTRGDSTMPFPVDEKNIQETEAALRIKFPEAFREKMLRQNGGEITIQDTNWRIFPIADTSTSERAKATENDIIRATKSAKKIYTFPNDGIAFAVNDAGDHLVFVKEYYHSDKLKNGVFYWNRSIGYVKRLAEDVAPLLR
jgi:hypothetical protein